MNKSEWKSYHQVSDEFMETLELVLKIFGGRIVAINDIVEKNPISINTRLIKGIGYVKNNKKSNKRILK